MSWSPRRRRARPVLVAALVGFIGALAVLAAWAVDSRSSRAAVLPRVEVGDRQVQGMDEAELAAWVGDTARRFAEASVIVRSDGGGFEATVPELGLAVDEGRTVADVMAAGRRGSFLRRAWTWARSFLSPVEVPLAVNVDRPTLDRVVAERDRGRTPPVEPGLRLAGGQLRPAAGENGRGISPAELAEALRRTEPVDGTITVTTDVTAIPPRFTEADAGRLAAEAERLATDGLQVRADDQTATVPPDSLRAWVRAVPAEESLRLGVKQDDGSVLEGLAGLLPEAGTPPVDAGFTVSAGQVSVTPARNGTACCAPEAVEVLDTALRASPRPSPVELPLKTVTAGRDEAAARELKIVEQVATFTTNHAAGEPRVRNIHRMADTLRGTVIPPGGTFSINGIVGMRTKDKGYVEAPIIGADYKFEQDVGGGVSQFATTMFNAAFFAGLDITEYYMHGLYISRYPYGREATLSFPAPDLKVRNNTPYGVLVWPTYTETSITVALYSTRHFASSEQTNQTRVERESRPPADAPPDVVNPGPCVTVTTERTRVYLDGRSVVDRFTGQYAPAEGWSCR
ncbi:MAG: VanW family protein [Acidimicrobiia bacterium]